MLVIEIQDSGAGISTENQSRLFKEIVQFNPEKLQACGGSGFGLWISKSIVAMHEGAISVHSEGEGHGSTFRLEIPMTRYVNHTSILVLKNDQTVSPKQCTDYDDHEEIKGNDDQLTNNNNNLVNSIHNSDNIPSKMKKKFLLIDDVA